LKTMLAGVFLLVQVWFLGLVAADGMYLIKSQLFRTSCIEAAQNKLTIAPCRERKKQQTLRVVQGKFVMLGKKKNIKRFQGKLQFMGKCVTRLNKLVKCNKATVFLINKGRKSGNSRIFRTRRGECLTAPAMTFATCVPGSAAQEWEVLIKPPQPGTGVLSAAAASTASEPQQQEQTPQAAANNQDTDSTATATRPAVAVERDVPVPVPAKSADYFFDPTQLRSFNIELEQNHLRQLMRDPTKEEYVPCSVVTDYGSATQQRRFTRAGCRYKGSVGSLRMCVNPLTNRFDRTGCRKLSLKVDANKFRDDKQTIYGMDKLIFNGMPVDFSLVSERLAYSLFQTVGVIAARSVHAKVFVNGQFDSVYTMVEPLDGSFTQHRFGQDSYAGEGGLYKDAWFSRASMPAGQGELQYFADLHQSGRPEHQFMVKVLDAVEAAPLTAQGAAQFVAEFFDQDSIVNVTAVNTLIGATDDWRQRHNFFWYVRVSDGDARPKLVMLPWDYDRINDDKAVDRVKQKWYDLRVAGPACANPLLDPEAKAREASQGYPAEVYKYWLAVWSELPPDLERPVQCDKFTKLVAVALKEKVLARVMELQQKINLDVIESYISQFREQIAEAVEANPVEPPYTLEKWDAEIAKLVGYLRTVREIAIESATLDIWAPALANPTPAPSKPPAPLPAFPVFSQPAGVGLPLNPGFGFPAAGFGGFQPFGR